MCLQACTHASVHAHNFLVCLGPYLSQFGSYQKDRDIYGIGGTCGSWLWCLCMCTQACTHASVHAHHFLACLGPYLSRFRSDRKDRDIYGIGGTCWSWLWCLCMCMQACTHASMHARYFLACLGPYLSQFGSDLKDRNIYRIAGTCRSWLWCLSMCAQACTHASVHAHYFLVCLGPYLSRIGSNQSDQSICGIRRTRRTCLST